MSPVGLNVLEYAFAYFDTTLPDGAVHNFHPAPDGTGWLITKINLIAAAALPVDLSYFGNTITVAAGGTLCLEPGGAARGGLIVVGDGARLIVEYWYKPAAPRGDPPVIVDVP